MQSAETLGDRIAGLESSPAHLRLRQDLQQRRQLRLQVRHAQLPYHLQHSLPGNRGGVSPGSPCIQYSEVSSLACLHFRSLSMARPMSRSSTACTESDLNVRPDLFRTLAKNWPYRVAQLE